MTAAPAAAVNYGFVIDNRRCIGCHACTVACKTEHGDPIGINKTWVQYVEKGVYPAATRAFHVLRCNHCADAPCVEICPTASLVTRHDGIVDFDPGRCIGCKACMQACPYDAIVLHADSGTATKCNYCSHRVDRGREPACVTVCPAEAILVGDLNDPGSGVSRIVAREETTVRKPEKGTIPNLYYVEGDQAALDPSAALRSTRTLWGERPPDGVDAVAARKGSPAPRGHPRRSYDISQRHAASWGWKVSAYLFTKSLAAGVFLFPALTCLLPVENRVDPGRADALLGIFFLAVTGALLVADLKRPERFLWVVLRPQWRSWLVRGAYIIAAYGAFLTYWLLLPPSSESALFVPGVLAGGLLAAGTAAYSAWLFGQAKGRDFWQSPLLAVHLLVQALIAGAALLALIRSEIPYLETWLAALLLLNALIIGVEIWGRHATEDARRAAHLFLRGDRSLLFVGGVLGAGHLLPILLLAGGTEGVAAMAGLLALGGLIIYEHLWVDAPQRLSLA